MHQFVFLLAAFVLVACQAHAEAVPKPKDRIWFIWENQSVNRELCQTKKYCKPISTYVRRLAEEPSKSQAQSLIGALDVVAKKKNQPVEHPQAPKICQHTDAQKIIGFEAESWPISDKLDALKGLKGVYFKLDGLKPPKGYDGPFGPNVQHAVEDKFTQAGIHVLSEKQREETPGKPHLNIYFSNTNPDTGCWFSVFASLSQTMLLTRNHTTKLKVGTWSTSGGYSPNDPDRSEFDAIMGVVNKFIADYRKANPRNPTTPKTPSKKKTKSKG